jgi:hypothetical protein
VAGFAALFSRREIGSCIIVHKMVVISLESQEMMVLCTF